MKNFTHILCLLFSVSSIAQFHHVSFSLNKDVSNALEKVLEDYPNHFNSIRSEIIGQDMQSTNYASTVNIEGADSGIIIQTGDEKENVFRWKENVFQTDNFDEAKAKFHSYFTKINGTSANVDGKAIVFKANYYAPDNSKRFASIIFINSNKADALKNVVIDLNMQYVLDGWQISINVYEHTDYGVDDNAQN